MFGLAGFKPALIEDNRPFELSDSSVTASILPSPRSRGLTNTMSSAVCAVDAAFADLADTALWCALTFELRGPRRQDALARTEKMYRVP